MLTMETRDILFLSFTSHTTAPGSTGHPRSVLPPCLLILPLTQKKNLMTLLFC